MGAVIAALADYIRQLPEPFRTEQFGRYLDRIHDRDDVAVYMNEARDFAFLYPPVDFDYDRYDSRVKRLGLARYKQTLNVLNRRYEKLQQFLPDSGAFLEIGSADAAFLELVHERRPTLELASVERDESFGAQRRGLPWLKDFRSFDDVLAQNLTFNSIGFFHTLEHMIDPTELLEMCRRTLRPDGAILVEVPTLEDPVLSVFDSAAYRSFYFQAQHPFVYSSASLRRLLEHRGWSVRHMAFHQRYGLENHLNWLRSGTPGGNPVYAEIFSSVDPLYRAALEKRGAADTLVVVAAPPRGT